MPTMPLRPTARQAKWPIQKDCSVPSSAIVQGPTAVARKR